MVKLINGRGQLGDALRELIKKDNGVNYPDCVIYHTWNIDDSSEKAQRNEYDKFVKFVDAHKDEKIYFISTKQGREIHYLHYKLKSELYLIENVKNGHIIRIPKLVGKGICADFRDKKIKPFNELEDIITSDEAAMEILCLLGSKYVMNIVAGDLVNKKTIYKLIQFGAAKCE